MSPEHLRGNTDVKQWVNSQYFNGYLFLLVVHLLVNIYCWIERPKYIETDWTMLIFIFGAEFFLSIGLNSIALLVFRKRVVPRQIRIIPILDLFITFLPGFIPNIRLWRNAMESYFFAVVTLIPLAWILYVRFIFLRSDH